MCMYVPHFQQCALFDPGGGSVVQLYWKFLYSFYNYNVQVTGKLEYCAVL